MKEAELRLMVPSNASTAMQKTLAGEWCTGVGMFKLTPAACRADKEISIMPQEQDF